MSQEVNMAVAFDLPVNLALLGTGCLSQNPVAGFLVTLLAFFVLLAVVAGPFSLLFDINIFLGLLLHAWSLGSNMELSKALDTLTGSRTVGQFLTEPLNDFLQQVLGGRAARSSLTVDEVVARVGRVLAPALSFLDYDNAFAAVQVPGEDCLQLLMCQVHGQVTGLPALLQRAYASLTKKREHFGVQKELLVNNAFLDQSGRVRVS
nr:uncharacterized protein LOC123768807 [Procambarus clarkii]